jgi:hypothetical protein
LHWWSQFWSFQKPRSKSGTATALTVNACRRRGRLGRGKEPHPERAHRPREVRRALAIEQRHSYLVACMEAVWWN